MWIANLFLCSSLWAGDLLRETFDAPEAWQSLEYPDVGAFSEFMVINTGTNHYIRANCAGAFAGLVTSNAFDVTRFPLLSWRWMTDTVFTNLDPRSAAGDDYPLRVRLIFETPKDQLRIPDKLAAIMHAGKPPPHSLLDYVWSGTDPVGATYRNPSNPRGRILVIRQDTTQTGVWVHAQANIVEDYRKAFGVDPPPLARLALICDSDNSGATVSAAFDDITLSSP